jgi:hypothetical protein
MSCGDGSKVVAHVSFPLDGYPGHRLSKPQDWRTTIAHMQLASMSGPLDWSHKIRVSPVASGCGAIPVTFSSIPQP